MTARTHFRAGLHNRQEPCRAGIENFGCLDILPCIHQNLEPGCPSHSIREEDKPMEWAPVGKHNHAKVVRRSILAFGDNPHKETR